MGIVNMEVLKINRKFKDNHKIFSLNERVFPEEERIPSHELYDLLQKLAELYKEYTIVLDMEQVDQVCDNPKQRKKRLEFYLRNEIQRFQNLINRVKSGEWNPVFTPLK